MNIETVSLKNLKNYKTVQNKHLSLKYYFTKAERHNDQGAIDYVFAFKQMRNSLPFKVWCQDVPQKYVSHNCFQY